MLKNTPKIKLFFAYLALWTVIIVWGIAPIFTKYYLQFYSATASVLLTSVIGFIFFFCISIPKLRLLNKKYFSVAITTGIFYSSADLLQKIGLQYTTPTRYAFLENLSCIIVPIILFVMIKKKPSVLTVISAVICLVGAYVLSSSGASASSAIGIGELLCALAGLFYGVNIAVTGIYAKELHAPLYLMIQMGVCAVISSVSTIAFNYISIGGSIIEPIRFSFDPKLLIPKVLIVLLSSSVCWLLRTMSMRYISPNAVAVSMPVSSVITALTSVATGGDPLSANLVVGGTLGFSASIMSNFGDRDNKNTTKKRPDNGGKRCQK